MKRAEFYAGIFLVCAAVTMLQIIETRLLSVTSFYYLAFLSISMAMFGMTAGAVWVYEKSDGIAREALPQQLAATAGRFAISIGICLLLQLSQPFVQVNSAMMIVLWAELSVILAIPFFFAGIVVCLALTRSPFPVGKVYAADLIGASLGCFAALGLMHMLDAPSAILVVGAVAAMGALCFARLSGIAEDRPTSLVGRLAARPGSVAIALLALAGLNSSTVHGLQPLVVKDQIDHRANIAYEKWNSYSRIHVTHPVEAPPFLWSASETMPADLKVQQRGLNIDGDSFTVMYRFDGDLKKVDFLKYDLTNVAYRLRHQGRAAVIGVGGGRDLLSAYLFGFRDITGVELNPIFIDLLTRRQPFAGFAGLAALPGLHFHVDDARSWFARTKQRFDLIEMSMVDTWAATGAGAFSLSENGLYTLEGWRHFVDALTPTGMLTVSRWYGEGAIEEAGRMVALGGRALMDIGVADPRAHLALVANQRLATLVLARAPFTAAELAELHGLADRMKFAVVLAPDAPPASPLLGHIAAAKSPAALADITAALPADLSPPSDDRPFFFNELPLSDIVKMVFGGKLKVAASGVLAGNIKASLALLSILVVAVLLVGTLILAPLRSAIRQADARLTLGGSAYFLLLGIGFMFVEIALLQRLSLFLGHPVYSLSIVLFAVILFTGLGSLLSERFELATRGRVVLWAAFLVAYLAALPSAFAVILPGLEGAGILVRGATAAGLVSPAGLLMGFGFPTGMRIVLRQNPAPAPWFWGINGAAGVLGSIIAVTCTISFGIAASCHVAALCYAALVPAVMLLQAHPDAMPALAAAPAIRR